MIDSPHLDAARRISSEVASVSALFRFRQASGTDIRPAELLPAIDRLVAAAQGLRDTVAAAAAEIPTPTTCQED